MKTLVHGSAVVSIKVRDFISDMTQLETLYMNKI